MTLAALERGAIDFLPKPDRHQITQLRESRDGLHGLARDPGDVGAELLKNRYDEAVLLLEEGEQAR